MPKGHKDTCLCVVCQQSRRKAAPAAVSAPTPTEVVTPPAIVVVPVLLPPATVRLNNLEPNAYFEIGGEKFMVKEKVEGMVVCCNLFTNSTSTLAGFTVVKPIE